MFRCLIICFVFETQYFVPFPPWPCLLKGRLTGLIKCPLLRGAARRVYRGSAPNPAATALLFHKPALLGLR